MEIITIKDEFIKLGQALKLSGLADSGIERSHCGHSCAGNGSHFGCGLQPYSSVGDF